MLAPLPWPSLAYWECSMKQDTGEIDVDEVGGWWSFGWSRRRLLVGRRGDDVSDRQFSFRHYVLLSDSIVAFMVAFQPSLH
jgi:hypothetical protein